MTDARSSPRRGCLYALGAAAALALLALALQRPILTAVARAMEVREPLTRADFIYLLNGDARMLARVDLAAALHRRGLAPHIVVARSEDEPAAARGYYPNDTDVSVRELRRQGVPDSAILVLEVAGGVTSTAEEGEALAAYLRRAPADTVLVVTSAYHTRRARWNLRHALGRDHPVVLRMAGAPHPEFTARDWWRSEAGLLAYAQEYLKFAHNRLLR